MDSQDMEEKKSEIVVPKSPRQTARATGRETVGPSGKTTARALSERSMKLKTPDSQRDKKLGSNTKPKTVELVDLDSHDKKTTLIIDRSVTSANKSPNISIKRALIKQEDPSIGHSIDPDAPLTISRAL